MIEWSTASLSVRWLFKIIQLSGVGIYSFFFFLNKPLSLYPWSSFWSAAQRGTWKEVE